MDISQFVYPLICWQTFVLFPLLGYYECVILRMYIGVQVALGYVARSGIARSHGTLHLDL